MKIPRLACSAVLALSSASPAFADNSASSFDDSSIHVHFQPTAQPRPVSDDPVEIPITLKPKGPKEYHLGQLAVPCSFNGSAGQCLLDTGAGVDVVFKGRPAIDALKPDGDKWDIRGACDQSTREADGVTVSDFRLGEARMGASNFERMDQDYANGSGRYAGVVGTRTLTKASRFSLRMTRAPALILEPRSGAGGGTFAVTSENQIIIQIPVGGVMVPALFDTGASGSVLDLGVIQANPGRFPLVPGSETSVGCSTGSKRKVAAYQSSGLQIGNVGFPARPFVAYDLSDLRKTLGADARMILGYDVISQLDWTFDWKARTWGASSGITIQTAESVPPSFDLPEIFAR